ncbi:MAG: HesB/IscA family protein [Stellaceae bacterium]
MTFELTSAAGNFVRRMLRLNAGNGFRLAVSAGGCSGLAADFSVEAAPRPGDAVIEHGGIRFYLPEESRRLLDGVTVDFADTPTQTGLVFHDPKGCACGTAGAAAEQAAAPALK